MATMASVILQQTGVCRSAVRNGWCFHNQTNRYFISSSVNNMGEREQTFKRFSKDVGFNKKDGVSVNYKLVYRLSLERYVEPAKYIGFGFGVFSVAMLPFLMMSQKDYLVVENFVIGGKFEIISMWSFITLHSIAMLKVVHSLPMRIYFSETEDNFLVVSNNPFLPWKKVLLSVKPGDLEQVLVPENQDRFRNLNYFVNEQSKVK